MCPEQHATHLANIQPLVTPESAAAAYAGFHQELHPRPEPQPVLQGAGPGQLQSSQLPEACRLRPCPWLTADGLHPAGSVLCSVVDAGVCRLRACPSICCQWLALLQATQPGPFAVRELLLQHARTSRLGFYLDLHAHANKRAVFAYGNALPGATCLMRNLHECSKSCFCPLTTWYTCADAAALEAKTYAKVVALNSPIFDASACNFSEQNMRCVNRQGEANDGSRRVAFYRWEPATLRQQSAHLVRAARVCSKLTLHHACRPPQSSHVICAPTGRLA